MANIDGSYAAAGYGEFHLSFAALETELTRSLVALERSQVLSRRKACEISTSLLEEFTQKKRMPFSKKIAAIGKLIREYKGGAHDDSITTIEAALQQADAVARWRNERIHGEVWFLDNRFVLLGDTGQPLQIDPTDCANMKRNAILALCEIQAHVSRLVDTEETIRQMTCRN
jgi:hypothetical protein